MAYGLPPPPGPATKARGLLAFKMDTAAKVTQMEVRINLFVHFVSI